MTLNILHDLKKKKDTAPNIQLKTSEDSFTKEKLYSEIR